MDNEYDAELAPTQGKLKRALMTVVLIIGFAIAESILWLFAVIQFIIFLFKGEPNRFIAQTACSVSSWVASIIKFVMFASNSAPFPFSPWPKNDD